MIYEFECPKCGATKDEIRFVDARNDPLECQCGVRMDRIEVTRAHISFGTFKPEYYHAFGKRLNSKHDLKNAIAQREGESGEKIIEVGNELGAMRKMKAEETKFDLQGAAEHLRKISKRG